MILLDGRCNQTYLLEPIECLCGHVVLRDMVFEVPHDGREDRLELASLVFVGWIPGLFDGRVWSHGSLKKSLLIGRAQFSKCSAKSTGAGQPRYFAVEANV